MSLKNLVQRRLISCNPDANIKEIAQMMDSENVGAVLVLKGERPVGIVTDRDLVVRCVVQGMDCSNSKVEDIMTTDVETVAFNDGLFDVVEKMRENKVRRLPVVDESGKAVGLISFGDILQLLAKEFSGVIETATPETPKLIDEEKAKAA